MFQSIGWSGGRRNMWSGQLINWSGQVHQQKLHHDDMNFYNLSSYPESNIWPSITLTLHFPARVSLDPSIQDTGRCPVRYGVWDGGLGFSCCAPKKIKIHFPCFQLLYKASQVGDPWHSETNDTGQIVDYNPTSNRSTSYVFRVINNTTYNVYYLCCMYGMQCEVYLRTKHLRVILT